MLSGPTAESCPLAGKRVWQVRRGIVPRDVPPQPVAFCGIARPQNFFRELRAAGVEPVTEAFYRDHHSYTENDIRELLELRTAGNGGGYVTTEKDAINLGPHISRLQPLAAVPVRMELADAPNAVDTLLQVIQERERTA